MKVKSESEVSQSCPTLSDPMNCSLPCSSVHGIFQARVLEWGAIAFSLGHYRETLLLISYFFIIFLDSIYMPSVQFSSVTQSCPTLCDPMNRSTPGLPVHHQLPEFSDAIQPSHPLSSPSPPAPNPSQHQSLFQ